MAPTYQQTRPQSGRQVTVAPAPAPAPQPTSVPLSEESLGDETSELEKAFEKALRKLKLNFEHDVLAAKSAELTMATDRAVSAETKANREEKRANELARSAMWRGIGAMVATIGSLVSIAFVVMVSKSIRTYLSDDIDEAMTTTEQNQAQFEKRIEATEKSVQDLRTDMKSEISDEFAKLRREILEALKPPETPPPPEKKTPKRKASK